MNEEVRNADVTIANLKRFIERGWTGLHDYLGTLSEEQMTTLKDTGGWTIKDHIANLALWEQSLLALINGGSQREGLNVDEATWNQGNDAINAVIQKRYDAMSFQDVMGMFQHIHDQLLAKIDTMTDADLMRPYNAYDTSSTQEQPIIGWFVGNTFGHYDEHQQWMMAIATQA